MRKSQAKDEKNKVGVPLCGTPVFKGKIIYSALFALCKRRRRATSSTAHTSAQMALTKITGNQKLSASPSVTARPAKSNSPVSAYCNLGKISVTSTITPTRMPGSFAAAWRGMFLSGRTGNCWN